LSAVSFGALFSASLLPVFSCSRSPAPRRWPSAPSIAGAWVACRDIQLWGFDEITFVKISFVSYESTFLRSCRPAGARGRQFAVDMWQCAIVTSGRGVYGAEARFCASRRPVARLPHCEPFLPLFACFKGGRPTAKMAVRPLAEHRAGSSSRYFDWASRSQRQRQQFGPPGGGIQTKIPRPQNVFLRAAGQWQKWPFGRSPNTAPGHPVGISTGRAGRSGSGSSLGRLAATKNEPRYHPAAQIPICFSSPGTQCPHHCKTSGAVDPFPLMCPAWLVDGEIWRGRPSL
jgi:hypothetical protein